MLSSSKAFHPAAAFQPPIAPRWRSCEATRTRWRRLGPLLTSPACASSTSWSALSSRTTGTALLHRSSSPGCLSTGCSSGASMERQTVSCCSIRSQACHLAGSCPPFLHRRSTCSVWAMTRGRRSDSRLRPLRGKAGCRPSRQRVWAVRGPRAGLLAAHFRPARTLQLSRRRVRHRSSRGLKDSRRPPSPCLLRRPRPRRPRAHCLRRRQFR